MKPISLRSLFGVVAWCALLLAILLKCDVVLHWERGGDTWGPCLYLRFTVRGRTLIDFDQPPPPPRV